MKDEMFTGESAGHSSQMTDKQGREDKKLERRSFLKSFGAVGATSALLPATFLAGGNARAEESDAQLTRGDAAILRFPAAAEIVETDLWQQYNELGGFQDKKVPGGSGNLIYTTALQVLDADMPQYIHDNTEDELTHKDFINAFLKSKGVDPVNLDQFRTLPSSKASGSQQIGRLTNLMRLTVDPSFWTRYRRNLLNRVKMSSINHLLLASPPRRWRDSQKQVCLRNVSMQFKCEHSRS